MRVGSTTAGAPPRTVQAARAATGRAVTSLRRLVRTWTAEDGLHPELAEDVVLAVDEAVTNVVEHAYPDRRGEVRLRLDHSDPACLEVTVEDDGTWRPPADPGFRGRGVQLMHRLADRAAITHSSRGTTVALRWETP